MRHTKAPVAGAILAVFLSFAIPTSAQAKSALAELRVEGPMVTLDPGAWYVTRPEEVRKSRPADDCERTGGEIAIEGPTPLSLVASGEAFNRDLSQVRVRRDEAGLFICEIGSFLGRGFTDPAGFAGWTYYEDFVFGSSAADQFELETNDRIMWVFSDFGETTQANSGDVLEMRGVPPRSRGTFTLRVVGHRFDGSVNPATGVTIEGAESVSDLGDGRYEVSVPHGMTTLRAVRGVDVPSNQLETCTRADLSDCPRAHGRTIVGSARGDELPGTRGFDDISGRGGDDTIDIRNGGRDRVNCGGGDDEVLADRGDSDDAVAPSCEKVKRT